MLQKLSAKDSPKKVIVVSISRCNTENVYEIKALFNTSITPIAGGYSYSQSQETFYWNKADSLLDLKAKVKERWIQLDALDKEEEPLLALIGKEVDVTTE